VGAAPPSVADVVRVLKPIVTQAPVELTVVGDVDETVAVQAAAATVGAIAPRRTAPPARDDAWFLRFPAHPPALVTGAHEGPPEKAVVEMVWPLWVAEPARRQEEYAILLASRVMSDALLRQIRGELGKAYSPTALTAMPDHADQGYLVAEAEVAAADADQARAAMSAVAAKVARGEFTDQDVENVRKPLLAAVAKQLATNDFWAGVLAGSSIDDAAVKEMPTFQGALAAITPAQVRKAAADWLAAPPIVVVVTGRAPEPAKQGPKP
jgi:zinc protease